VLSQREIWVKINCPPVDGMVYLEDIMESMSFLD
jgi:hypothetical protein